MREDYLRHVEEDASHAAGLVGGYTEREAHDLEDFARSAATVYIPMLVNEVRDLKRQVAQLQRAARAAEPAPAPAPPASLRWRPA